MKYYIKTYGCQMNEYDSNKLATTLTNNGYTKIDDYIDVDLVILNTCSIREKAAHKVYSELGRINLEKQKMKMNGKYMIIAVTGCVSETEKDQIFKNAPYVDIVIGPQSYHKIYDMITDVKNSITVNKKGYKKPTLKHLIHLDFDATEKFDFLDGEKTRFNGISAFVSIQEGCNKFCTYCVVPNTRGREVNRKIHSVLDEVNSLANLGVKEIVLLGQNVNSYQYQDINQINYSIADIIKNIDSNGNIERIKYTTSHPRDFKEDLLNAHANCLKLMPCLHLPVQSGSDKVLKQMNRKYTSEMYLDLIHELRKKRPNIVFSSDFIVGFPNETDEDFQATLDLVDKVNYQIQCFSFCYSRRPNTVANLIKDQIPEDIKKQRLKILQEKLEQSRMQFCESLLDKTVSVLFDNKEMKNPLQIGGRSEFSQIVIVNCDSEIQKQDLFGKVKRVKIIKILGNAMYGVIVND